LAGFDGHGGAPAGVHRELAGRSLALGLFFEVVAERGRNARASLAAGRRASGATARIVASGVGVRRRAAAARRSTVAGGAAGAGRSAVAGGAASAGTTAAGAGGAAGRAAASSLARAARAVISGSTFVGGCLA